MTTGKMSAMTDQPRGVNIWDDLLDDMHQLEVSIRSAAGEPVTAIEAVMLQRYVGRVALGLEHIRSMAPHPGDAFDIRDTRGPSREDPTVTLTFTAPEDLFEPGPDGLEQEIAALPYIYRERVVNALLEADGRQFRAMQIGDEWVPIELVDIVMDVIRTVTGKETV